MKSAVTLFCLCLPLAAGTLPLTFEPNQGQTDAKVSFLARAPGYTLFVTAREAVFAGRDGNANPSAGPVMVGNAFVTKLNPAGSGLWFSTYLGGGGEDFGRTAGGSDAFVTKINSTGSQLVSSTFLGGRGYDSGAWIAVDSAGNAYAAGRTSSVLPAAKPKQSGNLHAAIYSAFVSGIAPAVSTLPSSLAITGGNNQIGLASSTLPEPLSVQVTNSSGAGVAGVTVNFAVTSGAATLSSTARQTDSQGNASVTLTFGPVAGNVTVTAAIAGSTVSPVHFVETASSSTTCPIGPPAISSVNSATDFGGFSSFASGSYLEVKGTNLAIDSRQWAASDFHGSSAPISLDGSKVTINGVPGYVSFISSQQINVQAPSDSATGMVPIVVTNCAGLSNSVMLQKNAVSPGMLAPASFNVGKQYLVGLFASDMAQGNVTYVGNPGLIAGANFRPAKPNDVIVVYGLGFGSVSPSTPPGVIANGATELTGLSISFGSTKASMSYAGLYPGFVGLYEFFLTVPEVANGDSQINVSINGTPVPQALYLTVQQ